MFGIVHFYIVPDDSANYQEFWAIRRYFISGVTSNLRVRKVETESVWVISAPFSNSYIFTLL